MWFPSYLASLRLSTAAHSTGVLHQTSSTQLFLLFPSQIYRFLPLINRLVLPPLICRYPCAIHARLPTVGFSPFFITTIIFAVVPCFSQWLTQIYLQCLFLLRACTTRLLQQSLCYIGPLSLCYIGPLSCTDLHTTTVVESSRYCCSCNPVSSSTLVVDPCCLDYINLLQLRPPRHRLLATSMSCSSTATPHDLFGNSANYLNDRQLHQRLFAWQSSSTSSPV